MSTYLPLFSVQRINSANLEGTENVVVAGCGVVGEDGRQKIGARDSSGGQVEAAAQALAGAPARPSSSAVGPVERDETALEREAWRADWGGTAVEDAAAQSVAAAAGRAAGAADGPVQGDQRVRHREDAAVLVVDAAAEAVAARGPGAADGLVAENRAVVDVRDRGHCHGRDDSPENVVRDRAAPAVLRDGACTGGTTDGPVVRQCAMTDDEDRATRARDIRDGAANASAEAAWDAVLEPADGLVVVKQTVADGECARRIIDGAAHACAAGADAGRAAMGLIVEERAVTDVGRGRRARGPGGHDGAAKGGAADTACSAVPANGPVVDEATGVDGEGPRVEDAAAEGVHDGAEACAWEADDQVVRQDDVGDGEGAGVQDTAAAPNGPPMGDGQAVDAHRRAAADLEDPAGVVAADGQPVGARALDAQVVCDVQFSARQDDSAVAGRWREADQVGAGVGVGVEGRLPQGAHGDVGKIVNHAGGGHGGIVPARQAQRACRASP